MCNKIKSINTTAFSNIKPSCQEDILDLLLLVGLRTQFTIKQILTLTWKNTMLQGQRDGEGIS